MELIQIGDNALKVSLSQSDMEFYDIDFEMLDYKNSETKLALKSILKEANKAFGFDTVCDRLYIQAYRSKCGGCELFVQKEFDKGENPMPLLFRFESMELLLHGCARLGNLRCREKCLAYAGDDGSFYLLIYGKKPFFFCEIAKEIKYCKEYMAEHTTLISKNALCDLSPLA